MKKLFLLILCFVCFSKVWGIDKLGTGFGLNQESHGKSSFMLEVHYLPVQIQSNYRCYEKDKYFIQEWRDEIRLGIIGFLNKDNIKNLEKFGIGVALAFELPKTYVFPISIYDNYIYWSPNLLFYIGKIGDQINSGFALSF